MEIGILLALIIFNGLLSMSEIALVSARKSRLEMDAKKGNKSVPHNISPKIKAFTMPSDT